jgi:predicted HD phosphohydrolase
MGRVLGPVGSVDDLVALLASPAAAAETADGLGTLEHGVQCAAVLAAWRPADHDLQVAGLVHDIGHLLSPGDVEGHGRVGAAAVRPLLGDRVAALVELHVPAKRYLVTVDAAYAGRLSSMSRDSLARQGGLLDARGRAELEARPELPDASCSARPTRRPSSPVATYPGWRRGVRWSRRWSRRLPGAADAAAARRPSVLPPDVHPAAVRAPCWLRPGVRRVR